MTNLLDVIYGGDQVRNSRPSLPSLNADSFLVILKDVRESI